MNTPITKEVVWQKFSDENYLESVRETTKMVAKAAFDEAWNHQQSKLDGISIVIQSVAETIEWYKGDNISSND